MTTHQYEENPENPNENPQPLYFHPAVVITAQIISILFHPFFVLSYSFLLLAWSNPYSFGQRDFWSVMGADGHQFIFINIVMFTVTVPLFGILVMRGLKLVKDIQLTDRQDRTGPFILTGLFYIVIYLSLNRAAMVPIEYKIFVLGATIALFMAFFINLFSKISVHTVGMGCFLAIILVVVRQSYMPNNYLFIVVLIACGAVATARRVLTFREPSDIYGGFFIGFLAQFVSLSILAG